MAGDKRELAHGALLYLGNDRQAKGRNVHTSLDLPAHHGRLLNRRTRPDRAGFTPWHRPYVSCDGLGTSLQRINAWL